MRTRVTLGNNENGARDVADGAANSRPQVVASSSSAAEIDMREDHQIMRTIGMRSLAANKVRLLLTILAVVLGTSFVAGSMMFTRALSATFDQALNTTIGKADAVLTSQEEFLTKDQLASLRARDDVASAAVYDSSTVVLATEDRERISFGFARDVVIQPFADASASDNPVPTAATIVDGTSPTGTAQVLVPQDLLEDRNLAIGDWLVMVDNRGQREASIVGTYTREGQEQNVALLMQEDAYFDIYAEDGVNTILVQGQPDSSEDLVAALSADYSNYGVESGADYAQALSDFISSTLSFISYFLIAFGLLALLVGVFIIANTFSMIVAQRLKEFALLRALGVSKKQLARSVLTEAAIIGLIGSLLGVVVGAGLVQIIFAVMDSRGFALPTGGLGLSPGTIMVPVVLGMIVTVISAYAPAQRAAKIHPIEAMRSGEGNKEASLRTRTQVGTAVLVLGAALALAGALLTDSGTGQRTFFVGTGIFLLFIGIFLVGPALSIPVVGGLGKGIGKPFGAMGKLAATNSHRNPRRTATTAFALTIGVSLVASIGMLSSSMKASISELFDNGVKADFVVAVPLTSGLSIPFDASLELQSTPGVENAVSVGTPSVIVAPSFEDALTSGFSYSIATLEGDPTEVFEIEGPRGEFSLEEPGDVIVSQQYLDAFNLSVGDAVYMYSYAGSQLRSVTIVGVFQNAIAIPDILVSRSTFYTGNPADYVDLVTEDDATEEEEATEEEVEEVAAEADEEASEDLETSLEAAADDDLLDLGPRPSSTTSAGASDEYANLPETIVIFEDDPTSGSSGDAVEVEISPAAETQVLAQDDANTRTGSATTSQSTEVVEVVLVDAPIVTYAVYITSDGTLSNDELRAELENVSKNYIITDVYTVDEFADANTALVNQMMNLLYGLLALSVLVAVLGIINTLALNVIERRKEIGMLRAIGTQPGQVRRMIFLESIQIALFGALMGVITGLFMGWSFLRALAGVGIEQISVSWMSLVYLLLGSVVVGIVAAILPALRAAKTPPLEAIGD